MRHVLWLGCVALALVAVMSQATEEPAWTLVNELEEVEIRQYPPLIQARTAIDTQARSSTGFRTLANYIFGGNAQEQSIAMTAPVEETLTQDDPYMAFTMPAEYDLEDLPEPTDNLVTLHTVPARTMAVIRFSGWAREAAVAKHERTLLETLATHGWKTVGAPSLNQYNPPWTPPWSRRNEIMVEVVGTES